MLLHPGNRQRMRRLTSHETISGTHTSSWKLQALATCHGIVCEDRIGHVSARDCTVAQTESDT